MKHFSTGSLSVICPVVEFADALERVCVCGGGGRRGWRAGRNNVSFTLLPARLALRYKLACTHEALHASSRQVGRGADREEAVLQDVQHARRARQLRAGGRRRGRGRGGRPTASVQAPSRARPTWLVSLPLAGGGQRPGIAPLERGQLRNGTHSPPTRWGPTPRAVAHRTRPIGGPRRAVSGAVGEQHPAAAAGTKPARHLRASRTPAQAHTQSYATCTAQRSAPRAPTSG